MEKIDLNDVLRLARLGEDELNGLVAQLEYYPADAPTRSPLPRDLMGQGDAINCARSGSRAARLAPSRNGWNWLIGPS